MVENYSEDSIRTLDWQEHIRLRPGMYIGKLGDGSAPDDGIYILVKEVVDNSIDEFAMGAGTEITIKVEDRKVSVRDFGRGIPLGKLVDASSKMNTGAKYDSEAFKKSVGLNGVGIKAVNALSESFEIQSFRDGETKYVRYCRAKIVEERKIEPTDQPNGTQVTFFADKDIFGNYHYIAEYLEAMVKNYVFLNTGLTIFFNDHKYYSKRGLYDLLMENMSGEGLYPIIHLKGEDIEGRERRIGDHVRQDPALAKVVIDNGHSVHASSFLVFGSRMRKRPRCARRPSQAAIISKEDSLPPHHVIFSRNVVTKCKSLRGTAHALTFAVGVIQSPFGPMPRDSAALLPPVTRLPAAG